VFNDKKNHPVFSSIFYWDINPGNICGCEYTNVKFYIGTYDDNL